MCIFEAFFVGYLWIENFIFLDFRNEDSNWICVAFPLPSIPSNMMRGIEMFLILEILKEVGFRSEAPNFYS